MSNRLPRDEYFRLREVLLSVRRGMGLYGPQIRIQLNRAFGDPDPLGGKLFPGQDAIQLKIEEAFLLRPEVEQAERLKLILERDFLGPRTG